MARKRYFFVHLAIFAGLCTALGIAGISSYRDADALPGGISLRAHGGTPAAEPLGAPRAPGFLALSSATLSK